MNTSTDAPSEASTDRTMTPTAARGILAVRCGSVCAEGCEASCESRRTSCGSRSVEMVARSVLEVAAVGWTSASRQTHKRSGTVSAAVGLAAGTWRRPSSVEASATDGALDTITSSSRRSSNWALARSPKPMTGSCLNAASTGSALPELACNWPCGVRARSTACSCDTDDVLPTEKPSVRFARGGTARRAAMASRVLASTCVTPGMSNQSVGPNWSGELSITLLLPPPATPGMGARIAEAAAAGEVGSALAVITWPSLPTAIFLSGPTSRLLSWASSASM